MANRYWIGGTGTWNASNTANWSATTGPGTPGVSVPGAADLVIFDANSGGGTVTVAVGAAGSTITISSLTTGAHTGTITFSGNNNNVTLLGTGSTWFSGTGSGARTFNAGSGTWTLTGAGGNQNMFSMGTITGLTNPTTAWANATIVMTNTSSLATNFQGGGCTYGTVTFNGHVNKGGFSISGSNFFTTLNATEPNLLMFSTAVVNNITNTLALTGSSSSPIWLSSGSAVTTTTLNVANANLSWAMLRGIAITGAGVHSAINTIDLGGNTGWETLTAPTGGGERFSGFAG